jgi:hypothetical protein
MPIFHLRPGQLADDCAMCSAVLVTNELKTLAALNPSEAMERLRTSFRACLASFVHFRRRLAKRRRKARIPKPSSN